jgi:hypothetical protein
MLSNIAVLIADSLGHDMHTYHNYGTFQQFSFI